ncbi:enoyl-CoA hydratase/isomerase family protein [Seongchinamella sediminis]|uniref:Enoyl-CoA hydratase/isomerase family protein n=1 Tax=Seongchinamella sediminis TaxID=2283635 RepID=A0A3L7DXP1_9GAMM|nr:enoyl-CoA hydratase/isomerase family protein [Seongchinamella sediminis]RLQ21379.1 enoyl-CoA hydratase/isomerase family protein [Seongchinamella sediminis]
MYATLEVTAEGPIGRIWLNRPERLNALSTELLNELASAARYFDTQEQVKVVIVAGRGRAFSAGADLQGFPRLDEAGLRAAADAGRVMADAVESMRAITIAQVHGWCVGGGLVLAAACDLRLAADDARFSIPEVDLGIPLAWGGIPRLVREIGPALTKELVITCRPFDAAEAQAAGFLNRLASAEGLANAVQELAQQVAAKPAFPVLATKRHTDAVTATMVGLDRSWSDADSLIAGLVDPECNRAREAYIKSKL